MLKPSDKSMELVRYLRDQQASPETLSEILMRAFQEKEDSEKRIAIEAAALGEALGKIMLVQFLREYGAKRRR